MRRTAGPNQKLETDHGRHRVAGQTEDRCAVLLEGPEGERLGRPDRHLHPPHRPRTPLLEDHLDDVEIPHAHPAAGHHRVAPVGGTVEGEAERRFVIADDPQVDGDPTLAVDEGEEHMAIGVADLARCQRDLAP